jgi:hypothetical protein
MKSVTINWNIFSLMVFSFCMVNVHLCGKQLAEWWKERAQACVLACKCQLYRLLVL